jgi:hypothetical protein
MHFTVNKRFIRDEKIKIKGAGGQSPTPIYLKLSDL